MSSAPGLAPARKQGSLPPASSRGRTRFRLIPRLETNPQVITFAQTIAGKLTLLAVFGLALSILSDRWLLKLGLVAGMTFLPRARRLLVTVGTLLFTDFFWFERGTLGIVAAYSSSGFSRVREFFGSSFLLFFSAPD